MITPMYLPAETENQNEVQDYAAGASLDITSAVAAPRRAEISQMMYCQPKGAETKSEAEAHRQSLANMPPQQKMNHSQKHGFVQ
jgi:hypothetical protein